MGISVVIPLYNKAAHIKRTLEHVLSQTFGDYEIIVVNDGSTDNSEEIARSVKDDRIKIYSQENRGVSAARNRGVEIASNELIAFLDADDEWNDDYLEIMYSLSLEYPEAAAYSSNYYIVENASTTVLEFPGITEERGLIRDYFISGKKYTPMWTSATVVRKSAFLKAGGFPVGYKMCEDLDLWCRLSVIGDIAYINRPLATYERDSSNMASRSKDASCYFPFLDDFVKYTDSLGKERQRTVREYVESKKLNAVSYEVLVAQNGKKARKTIKKVWNSVGNKKKLAGYWLMSLCPAAVLNKYISVKKQHKDSK